MLVPCRRVRVRDFEILSVTRGVSLLTRGASLLTFGDSKSNRKRARVRKRNTFEDATAWTCSQLSELVSRSQTCRSYTCNSPSHVSVDGSCLTHFIHAYGYLPIHPKIVKNRVLPWSRRWLGSIIGSFGSAGRVMDLPRVPDGRAGSSRWGGAVGRVGGHR